MIPHIILVGPMGAGKTTIGRSLAKTLGLPFVDIDHLVEENTGADIPWIFDVEGEQGFRKRERTALEQALGAEPSVLATGGGIVTVEDNRKDLRKLPCVVYLQTSIDQQFERTAKDKNRPLLQTEDPKQTLQDLMAVRQPFYEEVASITVSTDQNKPKQVVDRIADYWKSL